MCALGTLCTVAGSQSPDGVFALLDTLDAGGVTNAAPLLARVAVLCVPRQAAAAAKALAADHAQPAPDWRAAGGLKGPYRETWAALREVGEAAVARQFAGPLPDDDAATLAAVLRHADPDRCTGCGLFHLIEALWRGFRQGSAHAKTICLARTSLLP